MHEARIIADLLSLGLKPPGGLAGRKGGAGPAEGGCLFIEGKAVNLPWASPFVADSPYALAGENGGLYLTKHGERLCPVELGRPPAFYDQRSSKGTPFMQLALLHGADCLATTVLQTCRHWPPARRCKFCGIELSLAAGQTMARKDPAELAEAAAWAKAHDGIKHVVLTTGVDAEPHGEMRLLADCARAINEASGLPVHAQFMPPADRDELLLLKEAGVDTAGIHIESFDQNVLAAVAPPKAALGRERYEQAWAWAVEIFGPGQVSSFVLAGLGEEPESLLIGCELLADMGVYPFLVPLRPIPGSLMADVLPPAPEIMRPLYEQVAAILARKGLSAKASKAGCVRCGACSALAAYEKPAPGLTCHASRTRDELEAALAVRRGVFVEEQGMFRDSDMDADDARSIHLVALLGGEVVGTVRVFPVADEMDHWIGGRLAVRRGHRAGGAGELLVREAMRTVKLRGCAKFTAEIQRPNVEFFKKIGWRAIGEPHLHHGRTHVPMQADLGRA